MNIQTTDSQDLTIGLAYGLIVIIASPKPNGFESKIRHSICIKKFSNKMHYI